MMVSMTCDQSEGHHPSLFIIYFIMSSTFIIYNEYAKVRVRFSDNDMFPFYWGYINNEPMVIFVFKIQKCLFKHYRREIDIQFW